MGKDLRQILLSLNAYGVTLAVASHDGKPVWCREVMDNYILDGSSGLCWGDLVQDELTIINYNSPYWPGKQQHLKDIRERVPDCEFGEMLIFDDSKSICKQARAQ